MNIEELKQVEERSASRLEEIDFASVIAGGAPVLFRSVLSDRPLVEAGQRSTEAAMAHIRQFHNSVDLVAFRAPPECKGIFSYAEDEKTLNFEAARIALDAFFEAIAAAKAADTNETSACYVGSTDLQSYFPGLLEHDRLALPGAAFEENKPLSAIWMGNRTTAAAHFDMSNNAAACMVGRRRFTLFPPDQIANLYPGPLFPTPGGQAISMVDFDAPDLDRFPGFEAAIKTAQVAEMAAGDLLVYPAMWWHRVDALDDFNVLINHWWNEAPAFLDSPMDTALHGILSLRDRSEAEKRAWRDIFDYYVFGPADRAGAHLPAPARGPLGPLDAAEARRLRHLLLKKLNR